MNVKTGSSSLFKNSLNALSWLSFAENRKISPSKSVMLCDRVFQALDQKLPNLHIKHEDNWCSIWDTGPILAWVSHTKFAGAIKIWFIGNLESARHLSAGSNIKLKLLPIKGSLGDCCGSFKISNVAQIPEAVELLTGLTAASRASRDAQLFETRPLLPPFRSPFPATN